MPPFFSAKRNDPLQLLPDYLEPQIVLSREIIVDGGGTNMHIRPYIAIAEGIIPSTSDHDIRPEYNFIPCIHFRPLVDWRHGAKIELTY